MLAKAVRDRVCDTIESYLKKHQLDWSPDGDASWYVRMDGVNKKGISMILRVGDRTLRVESYFIRSPEVETRATAYKWILQKNMRQYLRFACDEDGAIHLVGQTPLDCCDDDEVDRLIGSVLEYQDEAFKDFLQIGFPKTLQALREGKPVPEE